MFQFDPVFAKRVRPSAAHKMGIPAQALADAENDPRVKRQKLQHAQTTPATSTPTHQEEKKLSIPQSSLAAKIGYAQQPPPRRGLTSESGMTEAKRQLPPPPPPRPSQPKLQPPPQPKTEPRAITFPASPAPEKLSPANPVLKPTRIEHIVGNDAAKNSLGAYLKDVRDDIEKTKRCCFITGPPGVGKTTLATLAATEMGFHVVQFEVDDGGESVNLDDLSARFKHLLNPTTYLGKKDLVKKQAIIIIDGIDNIQDNPGMDRIVTDLLKFITQYEETNVTAEEAARGTVKRRKGKNSLSKLLKDAEAAEEKQQKTNEMNAGTFQFTPNKSCAKPAMDKQPPPHIICICTSQANRKVRALADKSLQIKMNRPFPNEIAKWLRKFKGYTYEKALALAHDCRGDITSLRHRIEMGMINQEILTNFSMHVAEFTRQLKLKAGFTPQITAWLKRWTEISSLDLQNLETLAQSLRATLNTARATFDARSIKDENSNIFEASSMILVDRVDDRRSRIELLREVLHTIAVDADILLLSMHENAVTANKFSNMTYQDSPPSTFDDFATICDGFSFADSLQHLSDDGAEDDYSAYVGIVPSMLLARRPLPVNDKTGHKKMQVPINYPEIRKKLQEARSRQQTIDAHNIVTFGDITRALTREEQLEIRGYFPQTLVNFKADDPDDSKHSKARSELTQIYGGLKVDRVKPKSKRCLANIAADEQWLHSDDRADFVKLFRK